MVTIHDVAREAGVSAATVSRVLNNNQTVGEGYAAKVHAAAERLGYRPNLAAQTLRTSASNLITLIVPDIYNGFHTAIARAVEDQAQIAGFSVLLGNSDEDPLKEAQYLQVSERHCVAGVLLCVHSSKADLSVLTRNSIPVVAVDRRVESDIDLVCSAGFEGAYEATIHLHREGWQRIACVVSSDRLQTHRIRMEGYIAAMKHLGLPPILAESRPTGTSPYCSTTQLIDSSGQADAFFTVNESTCLETLQELSARQKLLGQEIGIVSFDDTPWAPLVSTPITVVEQPAYEIGAAAARMLIERIQGNDAIPAREVQLPTRLIVRDSSKRRPL